MHYRANYLNPINGNQNYTWSQNQPDKCKSKLYPGIKINRVNGNKNYSQAQNRPNTWKLYPGSKKPENLGSLQTKKKNQNYTCGPTKPSKQKSDIFQGSQQAQSELGLGGENIRITTSGRLATAFQLQIVNFPVGLANAR